MCEGDSLTYHLGQNFSTMDQDNDLAASYSCAVRFSGAWWYKWCYESNLNGRRLRAYDREGVMWNSWTSSYPLGFAEMKIRPYEL